MEGFIHGPLEGGKGLLKGTASLVGKTFAGVGNTLSKITGSVAGGISKLTFDDKYIKIWPYLDNFVTNPYTFSSYSGDSDPKSSEYHKICMGLVRKLSRYRPFEVLIVAFSRDDLHSTTDGRVHFETHQTFVTGEQANGSSF